MDRPVFSFSLFVEAHSKYKSVRSAKQSEGPHLTHFMPRYSLCKAAAGSRSLTDTVGGSRRSWHPGESDGFRLICCTWGTERKTIAEFGRAPVVFCTPEPGNRPTGKNSVVWDSPHLLLTLLCGKGFVIISGSLLIVRSSSGYVLVSYYHMGGA